MARPARTPAREAGAGERIVAAAAELFALHGFEATTMRMLGDAVGLDNSSLYRHFAGKSEIANAVLDKTAADLLTAVAPLIDPALPASLDRLEDIAAAAGLHFFDRPLTARLALHWIMSRGESGSGFAVSVPAGDVTRPSGKLMALLTDWLAKGVRRGALRKHAVPEAIVILFGAILLRPATQGDLLKSLEPRRTHAAARAVWEAELRAVVRGAFAP